MVAKKAVPAATTGLVQPIRAAAPLTGDENAPFNSQIPILTATKTAELHSRVSQLEAVLAQPPKSTEELTSLEQRELVSLRERQEGSGKKLRISVALCKHSHTTLKSTPPHLVGNSSAQDNLILSLRKEIDRLNSRLNAEGGSARLPPSLVTSSSLFISQHKELSEAVAKCTSLTSQLSSMAISSSTYLAALKALTAMDVIPVCGVTGGKLGVGGVLSGAFTFTTQEPVNGKTVSFILDFYTAEDSGDSLVEYNPGVGMCLLPEFLHVSTPV